MKSLMLIATGFLLGFGLTFALQVNHEEPTRVNYIDQDIYEDRELDRALMIEFPQEQ